MKYTITLATAILSMASAVAQTPRITFQADSLYPEGVSYHTGKNMFIVGSVTTGTIGTVSQDGKYNVWYEDKSLKSSFGMKADEKRNRLWICTGDPTHSKYSDSSTYKKSIHLISLDLGSGKKMSDTDLSDVFAGKHFANDLALDNSGNIYVTDSYAPVIYKVDAQGKAGVFARTDLFKGENVGLNGIVWSAQGYLLTVNSSNGVILKVDLKNPQQVTKVKVKNFFPGADGLLWEGQNLVLIQNNTGKAFKLSSKDNWQSAEVTAATAAEDRFQYPTTGTISQGKVYLLNSKLNELDDPTLPPSKEFSLQLVQFKPAG